MGLVARADDPDASTNAPPLASSASLDQFGVCHFSAESSRISQPSQIDQSGLSLRPDAASTNSPPEIVTPEAGTFPEINHEASPVDQEEDLAAHLLVVYNTNDPDSQALARYYAAKRNIPAERILAISSRSPRKSLARNTTTPSVRRLFPTCVRKIGWRANPSGCESAVATWTCLSPPAMTSGPLCSCAGSR